MVRIEIVAVGVLGLVLAACTAGGATAVDATAVDATAVDATAVDATAVDWPAPVTATQFAAVEGNHNCLPRFTYDHVVWGLWRSTGSGPHALGAVLDGTSLGGANDMSCELLATAAGTILFTARDVMSPIGPRLVETTTNRTRQLGATFVAADPGGGALIVTNDDSSNLSLLRIASDLTDDPGFGIAGRIPITEVAERGIVQGQRGGADRDLSDGHAAGAA